MGRTAIVVVAGLAFALGGAQGACAAPGAEEPPPPQEVSPQSEAERLEAEAAAARERAAKAAEEARRAEEKALRARRRALEKELAAAEDALDAARDSGDGSAKARAESEVRRLSAALAVILGRTVGATPIVPRQVPRTVRDRPFDPAGGLPSPRPAGKAVADSVPAALDWLARHQSPGGSWDGDGFDARCANGKCPGAGGPRHDPGLTGLATLAFLGAGETHQTPVHGEVVRGALRYLKGLQDAEGCFGPREASSFVYDHALASLAMSEAYGLTQSPIFKGSAEAGAQFVLLAQNPYMGWRYGVRPGDNDTSVTSWMVLSLASARQAGIAVDDAAFRGALDWLDKVTEPEYGRAGYTARGNGPARPQELMDRFPADKSESMTAMAVTTRFLCGHGTDDPLVVRGLDLLQRTPPSWDDRGSVDFLYWYFGTLATCRAGGDRWRTWSDSLAQALPANQRGDADGCARGSWDPADPWGWEGGRVYSTAINTLTLEVHLRYAKAVGVR